MPRIRLLIRIATLAAAATAPIAMHGQGSTRDSTEIAAAIAGAVKARIPSRGPNRGAKMDQRPTSQFAAAAWTRLVGIALKTLDTSLVIAAPTSYTTSINVVSVVVAQDSLVARVAITQCRDTARGVMFGGTSYDYAFRRVDAKWILQSDQVRGHGDGRCK